MFLNKVGVPFVCFFLRYFLLHGSKIFLQTPRISELFYLHWNFKTLLGLFIFPAGSILQSVTMATEATREMGNLHWKGFCDLEKFS